MNDSTVPQDDDAEMLAVWDMHRKFGFTRGASPRVLPVELSKARHAFMMEELEEFQVAMEGGDLAGMADALIDLVYVAKGTAVMMGLPWEELFWDVHRANMSKERGITARGMAEDLIKPDGWQPPRTVEILAEAGWADYVSGGDDDQKR